MMTLIVHLSDIHFKAGNNSALQKKECISKAFQNEALAADNIFVVVTGDISTSGKEKEFHQAKKFIDDITQKTSDYSGKEVFCLMVPGNHDCNYETGKQKVRETLINQIQKTRDMHTEFIDQCCEVQSYFFEFCNPYKSEEQILHSDKLLNIIEYKFGEFNIVFNCYNTAWISQLNERPGKIYFPIDHYPEKYLNYKANLNISLLHHTFNWLDPETRRKFINHVEATSDIVLTGHEHVFSKSIKDDLEGNYTGYVEGAVLQDHNDNENSGFNVITLDAINERQRIVHYKWNRNYGLTPFNCTDQSSVI